MKLSYELWPNDPYDGMGATGVAMNSWANLPIEEQVDRVAKYGYQGVDFFHHLFLKMDDKELDRVRNTLKDYVKEKGLTIPSIGAHHLVITDRPWEIRGQIDLIKQAIDLAVEIGAETVVSYIGGYYNPPTYKLMTRAKAVKILVDSVREFCDYAGEKGLTFSIEPHQETLIDKPEVTMEIVEKINRENLRISIDFGGLELGVKPVMPIEKGLKMYGELINSVHAKDITGVTGNWNMCWFGGGLVDFKRYAEAFRQIGYDGFVTVEWEGWFKGGEHGLGDLGNDGLGDFDLAAPEAYKFLSKYFY
ncbi:MAG: sugar phosphate isomerase/epimerase [Halanaerobiales bacterium]|nr:sugar phosphate isomerase/epimerase [Halanaerobiales bacterium]